jgi:hypothetical protein
MQALSKKRDSFEKVLIISLLLHFILMWILLTMDHEHAQLPATVIFEPSYDQQEQIQQAPPEPLVQPLTQQQPPKQLETDELDFMLNLKESSKFGATRMVQEEPEFIGHQDGTDIPFDAQTIPEPLQPSTEPEMDNEQPSQEAEADDTADATPQEMVEPSDNPIAGKTIEPAEEKKVTPDHSPLLARRRLLRATGKKNGGPIPHGLTLQKLAEGFLDYVKTNNSEPIDLNTHDLKYVGYMRKVGWLLQNSFNINKKRLFINSPIIQQVVLHIEIDKKGDLINCCLSPNIADPDINTFFLDTIKSAAPFPKIPDRLNRETIRIKMPIAINLHRGFLDDHAFFYS